MNFTRKIDRAKQWAGEKMGAEAKATHTEEFKALESEMDVQHDGLDRLSKSMNIYTRWLSRRCDTLEDRSRSTPLAQFGRTMSTHGAELDQDSELGRRLISLGGANEQLAELQTTYIDRANATWSQQIDRDIAMMKEYQAARKKLESRRLAYDATMGRIQKAKKDDVRLEEELCINKTKFEDSTEDVFRRMQDIKEAEADTVMAITSFLDAELEFHERATNELRQVQELWSRGSMNIHRSPARRPSNLERTYSNASTQLQPPRASAVHDIHEISPAPASKLVRIMTARPPPPPPPSSRPPALRSATFDTRHITRSGAASTSLMRATLDSPVQGVRGEDVGDDMSTCSGDNSSGWRESSISPATSYGSLHGSHNIPVDGQKAPAPRPVDRSKKPPPPPVPRKLTSGHRLGTCE